VIFFAKSFVAAARPFLRVRMGFPPLAFGLIRRVTGAKNVKQGKSLPSEAFQIHEASHNT
jgi:hypothetical protein